MIFLTEHLSRASIVSFVVGEKVLGVRNAKLALLANRF